MGTGAEIVASLCGSDYDTKIDVYSGDCNNLVCVGSNDNSANCANTLHSEFMWLSNPGTTYFIRVHGNNGNTGDYQLSLECLFDVEIAIEDPCSCDDPLNIHPWGGQVQLFHDVLTVTTGVSGQIVTLDAGHPNFVDSDGNQVPDGVVFAEGPAGVYTYSFYRFPASAFTVTVSANGITEDFTSDDCLEAEECGTLPIPTMSEWGLILLALFMLQGIWFTLVFKPVNALREIPALWFQGLRAGLQDKNMLLAMVGIGLAMLSMMTFFGIAQAADLVGIPLAIIAILPSVHYYRQINPQSISL